MTESSNDVYLLDGKRTPFGKFGGSFAHLTPLELTKACSQVLCDEHKIKSLDHVIFSNVIPVTPDTLYAARHLALSLGMDEKTPAYALNRLCGSGIQAIWDARNQILVGDSEVVLVAGAETMSMAPHLVYGGRFGTRYGSLETKDFLFEALTDNYCKLPMGITAENMAKKYDISRQQSDSYSFMSHQKASQAFRDGHLKNEIVPVLDRKKKIIESDEHIRYETSIEEMAGLRTTFDKNGVVTAGSASGVVDGAAASLIASGKYCSEHNLRPLAKIIGFSVVGVDPAIMGIGPVPAINDVLTKNNFKVSDIDLFEINEAFAPQVLSCIQELKLDGSKVNIWGGAIAMGHPLGATGTRIALTLARQLKKLGKKRGIASACIGGGQGIAMILEAVDE